jgi:hypothetical protein
MRVRWTNSVRLALFICLSGCKTTADRPANVPASAARIGGVFIDCSVEESSRANRCAVYEEGSGEVQVSRLFELSGAGREAKQAELRYMAFDGTRIWLQDARSLHPVLLVEYAVPGMAKRLAALAGKDAQNCGRVTRNQMSDGNRTVLFQHAEPGEWRRRLVGGLTHKRLSVKQNFPGRIELLQEIKINNIAGQHGAAMLSSGGK